MTEIIHQLELDQTFFIQFGLICFIFLFLSQVYFKPFQKLLEARHNRTIKDRAESEKLLQKMNLKIEEYRAALAQGRVDSQKLIEAALQEAKLEEKRILDAARTDARSIALETAKNLENEKNSIRADLKNEIGQIVSTMSAKLLGK